MGWLQAIQCVRCYSQPVTGEWPQTVHTSQYEIPALHKGERPLANEERENTGYGSSSRSAAMQSFPNLSKWSIPSQSRPNLYGMLGSSSQATTVLAHAFISHCTLAGRYPGVETYILPSARRVSSSTFVLHASSLPLTSSHVSQNHGRPGIGEGVSCRSAAFLPLCP